MVADPSPATAATADLGAADALQLMADGQLRSVELTEALLRRIAEIDGPGSPTALRSVMAVSERATDEAAASDRRRAEGRPPRPLEGIPVLVKDNIEVAGLPAAAGATSLEGRPATGDAPLVTRLRHAGAVILASTNLSQWANIRSPRSTGGWSAMGGLTANPWALDRNAGGSSSGSGAALAAGLAPLAVGTETDGSITCPASLNGVTGIKPAVGAVPGGGIVPISSSQDSAGPMARSAADTALLLEVLTGRPVTGDRLGRGIAGLRIATAVTWVTGHPATDALFGTAVERLRAGGAEVVAVSPAVPADADVDDELTVMLCELVDGLARYLPTRGPSGPQDLAQVVAHEVARADVELRWFGHELFEKALTLGGCASDGYRRARERNLAWALGTCLEPAMDGVDVMVAPTYGPAWKSDLVLGGHPAAASPATMAPAIAGWPIATAPMGLCEGLPVGMGIIGRPGREADLLAVAAVVEQPARPAWRQPNRG